MKHDKQTTPIGAPTCPFCGAKAILDKKSKGRYLCERHLTPVTFDFMGVRTMKKLE